MADITACKGGLCPVKEKCYRFYCPKDELQSYFTETPFTYIHGVFKCDEICGLEAESMAKDINTRINGHHKTQNFE